ncbi:AAA family ATPase, partial [Acinetobacter baumannii]
RDILDAEARLLSALDDLTAPTADAEVAGTVADDPQPPRHAGGVEVRLAVDQVYAVTQIATSGRRVEVLVGPAGTGKTTTLRALRTVWE